MKSSKL